MQLSICIPIYQLPVHELVAALQAQLRSLKLEAEILLLDDGSAPEIQQKNEKLAQEPAVRYQELPENVGRAAIRNQLAQRAQGEFLLFLDCDSAVISDEFLERYWQARLKGGVVCGGRQYPKEVEAQYALHHQYGTQRESAVTGKQAHTFHSNNFLIDGSLFDQVRFNENLKKYGHEDTLFGWQLQRQGLPVRCLNNPVLHAQLETSQEFLAKTRAGLQNILLLAQADAKQALAVFPMYRLALKVQALGLGPFFKWLFQKRQKAWERQLCSKSPSLRVFDLYRLGYLVQQLKS